MSAKIIDGKEIAANVRAELKEKVAALGNQGISVTLAVVLVGENPASKVYVRNKIRACEECGIINKEILLPETASEEELLAKVDELNADPSVNGILVQLPLPSHMDEDRVSRRIDPKKDVGFSSGKRRSALHRASGLCFLHTGRYHSASPSRGNRL